jgi:hypothetical protein
MGIAFGEGMFHSPYEGGEPVAGVPGPVQRGRQAHQQGVAVEVVAG